MIELSPIGVIHTPYTKKEGIPIQPAGARGIRGTVEIFEEYRKGIRDLEGFSHIFLIYHFHLSKGFDLQPVPFMDKQARGVFATRAPKRPNSIGLSIVELESVADGLLHILNVDMVDGTPLLDIKPYVPEFDSYQDARIGWLEEIVKKVTEKRSDNSFD